MMAHMWGSNEPGCTGGARLGGDLVCWPVAPLEPCATQSVSAGGHGHAKGLRRCSWLVGWVGGHEDSLQKRARRAGSRQLAVRPWLERAEVPQPAAGIAGTNLLTVPEKSRAKNVILHTHPNRGLQPYLWSSARICNEQVHQGGPAIGWPSPLHHPRTR